MLCSQESLLPSGDRETPRVALVQSQASRRQELMNLLKHIYYLLFTCVFLIMALTSE